MKEKLDLIEARLQALIEGSLAALLPWGNPQRTLAHLLVNAMQVNLVTGPDGRQIAPNIYQIQVDAAHGPAWQANQAFLDDLAHNLAHEGSQAGFQFAGPPILSVVADPGLSPGEVRVMASSSKVRLDETAAMSLHSEGSGHKIHSPAGIPPNAFIIVNSTQVFPLILGVVNLGRRLDNQVVIDDPRVSRRHAQLRVVKGRFVIFDLSSSGGTFVNNQRISQAVLNPGDVISLSGVPIIFGQDVAMPDLPDTGNYAASSSGRASSSGQTPSSDSEGSTPPGGRRPGQTP